MDVARVMSLLLWSPKGWGLYDTWWHLLVIINYRTDSRGSSPPDSACVYRDTRAGGGHPQFICAGVKNGWASWRRIGDTRHTSIQRETPAAISVTRCSTSVIQHMDELFGNDRPRWLSAPPYGPSSVWTWPNISQMSRLASTGASTLLRSFRREQ